MTTTTPTPVAKSLPEAFRNATLYSDEDRTYRLLRFPTSSMNLALQLWKGSLESFTHTSSTTKSPSSPFGGFLVDKDEISMIVSSDTYLEYCNNRNATENDVCKDMGIPYRLFTFDNVVLDPSLVGFMAVVTRALADHNISVLPYAAYSTDHIFVSEEDAQKTKSILEGLGDGVGVPIDNT